MSTAPSAGEPRLDKLNTPMPLTIRSRQKSHSADAWLLRRLAKWVLVETESGQVVKPVSHELGVYLVGPAEMAKANGEYLQHDGPTDVITFDYGAPGTAPKPGPILGDIFICPSVAEEFAEEFKTSWEEEVARYLIHGILHLRGYDDSAPGPCRTMKREENRLMKLAAERFPLSSLTRQSKTAGG
ncbi:MAG TPA: rRNA maturation RNase YbeY [Verrucomicrobiota bacterium]|nr:rRNA maturation RNase YbeY [Verrucomicrobiota bacterium]